MPTFRTENAYWYNAGIWGKLGFAVPNFGQNPATQNAGIAYLVRTMGKALFSVMNTPDTELTTPPSINTITAVHQLVLRANGILTSRGVAPGTPTFDGEHTAPGQIDHIIYPCPYFMIRNPWIQEWGGLVLSALSEAMQSTENLKQYDFSTTFSSLVWQYLQRIYVRMAIELLQIPAATAQAPNFTISPAQLAAYNPAFFTSTESVDAAPSNPLTPSAGDLQFLAFGIPAKNLVGLCLWPNGDPIPAGIPNSQLAPNAPGPVSGADVTDAVGGLAPTMTGSGGVAQANPGITSIPPFVAAPSAQGNQAQ